MSITISTEPSAVRIDETGTIRVGATRVTLDSLIAMFSLGATPEQIAQDYTSLDLAEVYAAIAYYLRHRNELDEYVARREEKAAEFHASHPELYARDVRERLMARSDARRIK